MTIPKWLKTLLIWVLGYLPAFVIVFAGFSIFGLGFTILFGLLMYLNPDFRAWLSSKKGFRARLSKLPGLSDGPKRNNAIFLVLYLLPFSFLAWLALGNTYTDDFFVSVVLSGLGMIVFYGLFIQGWFVSKEKMINEAAASPKKMAEIFPNMSLGKISDFVKANVVVAGFGILALISPLMCFGSGAILLPDGTATPAATDTAQARLTPEPNPTSSRTQTPHVIVVTATEEPFTHTPDPTPPPSDSPSLTPTPSLTPPALVEGQIAEVVEVVDGDTIKVDIKGEIFSLRYIGIDTPEVQHQEWMGAEASEANAELVFGEEVILEKDVSETDQYGRLLRYVYLLDGTFVNAELVKRGLAEAKAYPPDTKYHDLLEGYEEEARVANLGLWQPTATPAVQPTSAGLVIQIVSVNKRAEYVDIENFSDQHQDLGGWILRSEKGTQDCPLGGSIGPGETLRIWALSEDSDHGGYNCGFGRNIWNNSESDPAVLLDSQGVEVDRYP